MAAAVALVATDETSSSSVPAPPLAPDHPLAVEALTLLLTLTQEHATAAAAPAVLAGAGLYRAWLAAVEARLLWSSSSSSSSSLAAASASLNEAALLGDFAAALVLSAPTSQASQVHARALLRAAGSPVAVVAELMRRLVAADEEAAAGDGPAAGGTNPVLDGLRRLHSALVVAQVEGAGEASGEGAGDEETAPPLLLTFPSSAGAFARRLLDAPPATAEPQYHQQQQQPPPPRRAPSFSVLEAAAGLLLPPGPLPGPAAAVGSALGSVPALAWATVQATRRRFVVRAPSESE